ncbi:DUF1643 domain-containing protein [Sporolactobacillus putidus]|uniref:DUF1643 domain-containing protein n=1 Tax=Sporolactobacillus putidus TaxID=492735 RepID=A0A917S487_9BACL|nr:DUF1643 domain-containing protein [Sporolactobacillus putidus]GGL57159.1 hypothetical protein GCM10007968_21470 [Sporolactobacillus putidus]
MNLSYPDYVITPAKCKFVSLSHTEIRTRLILKANLNIEYHNNLLFILMNPSKANRFFSDRTVNKLAHISYFDLRSLCIGSFSVVNVFPFCRSNSSELHDTLDETINVSKRFYYRQLTLNLREIYSSIDAADYVFLGTGGIPANIQDKEEYDFMIKTIHSYVETLKGQALLGKGENNETFLKDGKYSYHLCPNGNPQTINRARFFKLRAGKFVEESKIEYQLFY